jgi:hypothetical protein
MTEAERLLAVARAREDRRAAVARPRPDYAAINAKFKVQKGALTRAVNSGQRDKIVVAVAKAVREWSEAPFNGMWPDDWSNWQRALDDAFPVFQAPDIRDLA